MVSHRFHGCFPGLFDGAGSGNPAYLPQSRPVNARLCAVYHLQPAFLDPVSADFGGFSNPKFFYPPYLSPDGLPVAQTAGYP